MRCPWDGWGSFSQVSNTKAFSILHLLEIRHCMQTIHDRGSHKLLLGSPGHAAGQTAGPCKSQPRKEQRACGTAGVCHLQPDLRLFPRTSGGETQEQERCEKQRKQHWTSAVDEETRGGGKQRVRIFCWCQPGSHAYLKSVQSTPITGKETRAHKGKEELSPVNRSVLFLRLSTGWLSRSIQYLSFVFILYQLWAISTDPRVLGVVPTRRSLIRRAYSWGDEDRQGSSKIGRQAMISTQR